MGEPVLDVDRIVEHYPDALSLMRELKAIGAHNVTRGRARGLTGRRRLAAMVNAYETLRRDGTLPATWEVIHASAWGSARRATENAGFPREAVDLAERDSQEGTDLKSRSPASSSPAPIPASARRWSPWR